MSGKFGSSLLSALLVYLSLLQMWMRNTQVVGTNSRLYVVLPFLDKETAISHTHSLPRSFCVAFVCGIEIHQGNRYVCCSRATPRGRDPPLRTRTPLRIHVMGTRIDR